MYNIVSTISVQSIHINGWLIVGFVYGRFCFKRSAQLPSLPFDTSNEEIIKTLLKKCKIDSNNFFSGIKDPIIKNKLKKVTQEAHKKEIFGVPTFVVNEKIFWGQDRLDFALDEYNKQFKLF